MFWMEKVEDVKIVQDWFCFTWPLCAQFADQDEIHSKAWDCKKCAYYLVNYLAQS